VVRAAEAERELSPVDLLLTPQDALASHEVQFQEQLMYSMFLILTPPLLIHLQKPATTKKMLKPKIGSLSSEILD